MHVEIFFNYNYFIFSALIIIIVAQVNKNIFFTTYMIMTVKTRKQNTNIPFWTFGLIFIPPLKTPQFITGRYNMVYGLGTIILVVLSPVCFTFHHLLIVCDLL